MGRKCPFPTQPQHLTRDGDYLPGTASRAGNDRRGKHHLGQLPHKGGIVNRSLLNYERVYNLNILVWILTRTRR